MIEDSFIELNESKKRLKMITCFKKIEQFTYLTNQLTNLPLSS